MAGVLLYHCCKLKPFTSYSCFYFCCDFNNCVTVSCKLLKHCAADVSAPNMVFTSLLPLKLAVELQWSRALESDTMSPDGKPELMHCMHAVGR